MIEKILEWAWINGLDVRLESKSYALPGEHFGLAPRREAPNYVKHDEAVVHMPILKFSRGERHIQVTARNWAELKEILKYKHQRIFAELAIQPLEVDNV